MKKVFVIIGIIIGVILLDSIQALVFDNNPLFKIREHYDGGELNYKDKGILVDTYCGINGKKDTVIKGFSYSLSDEDTFEIVDKTKNMEDFACDDALEEIYEDENYIYYLPCIKSRYIEVRYKSLRRENIISALANGNISIGDLDKFDIYYIKEKKEQEELQTPPDLFVYIDDNTKAKALLGTYSWKITKDGIEEVIAADSKHPSQIKYEDINTLKLNDTKVNIESNNATISSANIYNIDKTESIKKISWDNNTIMLGNLKAGEYVLEIVASYSQGKVYYGVKLVVE